MNLRKFAETMARTLWADAWFARTQESGYRGRKPGPGEDIIGAAPRTPRSAFEAAWRLLGAIEHANGRSIWSLVHSAAQADSMRSYGTEEELTVGGVKSDAYEASLAHYLVMGALGHGASWFDDHAPFGLTLPHTESMAYQVNRHWQLEVTL